MEMAILRVFTAIAWIDGELHDAERSALVGLAAAGGIPLEKVFAVLNDFAENVDTVAELLDWIEDDVVLLGAVDAPSEIKAGMLATAIMFMKSDGVNHPNEKKLIENMAKVWKVSLPEGTLD